MNTTVISNDDDSSNEGQVTDQVASAAMAAGVASAEAADATESATIAESSAGAAISAAESVNDSAERSEAAASVAQSAATEANAAVSEFDQLRNEIKDSFAAFAAGIREAAGTPGSPDAPTSPPPRSPVAGPENDSAPGKTHPYYRKWGRQQ